MKCDELKSLWVYCRDINENVDDVFLKFAPKNGYEELVEKSEVDEAIAELKQKLEDAKATAYAESVDAGMENRRLKRALWLARAAQAYSKQYWGSYVEYVHLHENSFYQFINDDIFRRDNPNNDSFRMWSHRWRSVEIKCLNKAEEYK